MWPLAIGAGVAANVAGVFLAAACSGAGWLVLSRLVQLMRWLALAGAAAAAVELSRHRSAGTAPWLALAIVGGGLAVGAAALAGMPSGSSGGPRASGSRYRAESPSR